MFRLPNTKRSRIQAVLVLLFLVAFFFAVQFASNWVERNSHFIEMRELVYRGDHGALERMLSDGANPNARNPVNDQGPGGTLLHVAADEGDLRTVDLLLEYGANPRATDRIRATPLHYAAKRGRIDIIKRLAEEEVDLHAIADFRGDDTPAALAMDRGQRKAAKYILFEAAKGDLRGEPLERLLHMAANNDEWDMVRQLLEAGADPGAQEELGSWPLSRAVMSGSVEPVNLLLQHGATPLESHPFSPPRLLWVAARAANPEVIQILYDNGLSIDMRDDQGRTALHHAARETDEYAVEYLIELGADVNARADAGETPLYAAVGSNRMKNVRILLKHGADPSLGSAGETPLELAARTFAENPTPGSGIRSSVAADILNRLQSVASGPNTTPPIE
jgi:ankyrin repeat protein